MEFSNNFVHLLNHRDFVSCDADRVRFVSHLRLMTMERPDEIGNSPLLDTLHELCVNPELYIARKFFN